MYFQQVFSYNPAGTRFAGVVSLLVRCCFAVNAGYLLHSVLGCYVVRCCIGLGLRHRGRCCGIVAIAVGAALLSRWCCPCSKIGTFLRPCPYFRTSQSSKAGCTATAEAEASNQTEMFTCQPRNICLRCCVGGSGRERQPIRPAK